MVYYSYFYEQGYHAMDNQVFRQKSIERIASPEQLHDYLRVTSPRVWMLLAAVIALVGGIIIAACTLQMESTLDMKVTVEEGDAPEDGSFVFITLPPEQKSAIRIGMTVRLAGSEGTVDFLYESAENVHASVIMKDPDLKLPSGQYDGQLVLETTTPISFLLN